jgi:glycerol uptake facilitator protein
MHGPVFGEFLGTLVLILFGDGVVACVLLNKSKGQNSGWIVITTGWGFAVTAGIFVSLAVGGVAHLNCAVTFALALAGATPWSQVPGLVAGQFAGSFVGAVLVWLTYLPHWAETDNQDFKRLVFCTAPAIRNIPANFLTEVIATAFLIIGGFALGAKGVTAGSVMPTGYAALYWGIVVWVLGLSLGGPTGYAMNPNRDLSPRIAHAVLPVPGKSHSDWGYALVPVIGPLVGAGIGSVICKACGIL